MLNPLKQKHLGILKPKKLKMQDLNNQSNRERLGKTKAKINSRDQSEHANVDHIEDPYLTDLLE